MFKGSENVVDGEHFRLLQDHGATVNGSTTEDRTNYYEVVPAHQMDLALYLESDRMGFLLPALTQEKLENQRDVVKNERRQSYENQPYGRAHETLIGALFPPDHPHHWPVIGSMADLSAASLEDARSFFQKYYIPANASIGLAGDFSSAAALESVERYFGAIARGPRPPHPVVPQVTLPNSPRLLLSDSVSLPRLYIIWHGPAMNSREDAVRDLLTNLLSFGRTSRLYRSLVYHERIAQSVHAYQDGMEQVGCTAIVATAQKEVGLTLIEKAIWREVEDIVQGQISAREFEAARNAAEMSLMDGRVSALQKANGLATYFTLTGDAENFNRSLARFDDIKVDDLREAAREILSAHRVILSVVPHGHPELAAEGSEVITG
jgi:zinc protease